MKKELFSYFWVFASIFWKYIATKIISIIHSVQCGSIYNVGAVNFQRCLHVEVVFSIVLSTGSLQVHLRSGSHSKVRHSITTAL